MNQCHEGSYSAIHLIGLALLGLTQGCASAGQSPSRAAVPGAGPYEAWVASEAVDRVSRIRFDGSALEVVESRPVGNIPVELEGPHGVALSPDGAFLFVTLGHGLPTGSLLKIETTTGRVAGRTPLGLFPATVSVSPDGRYGFVSNFNLHGDHVPSSISMVDLASMAEVARTETCVMPHGSRIDPTGERHYSVCMMDELLVEIDARTGSVLRMFSLTPGREGPAVHESHPPGHAPGPAMPAAEPSCSPTWAEPAPDGTSVYVTCNRGREVLEIDVGDWSIARRFATGDSPYNIAVTPDGTRLLVSLRSRTEAGLEIWDLRTGTMAARVPATTTLAHGVAATHDSRYAFLTVEGVGSEPGRVDVIDLAAGVRVASVPVGQQATGVALVPPRR